MLIPHVHAESVTSGRWMCHFDEISCIKIARSLIVVHIDSTHCVLNLNVSYLGVAVPPPPGVEPLPKPPGWTTLVTMLSPRPSDAAFVRTSLQRLRISCHGNVQDIACRLAAAPARGPKGRENPRDNAANLQRGRDALIAARANHLGSILRRWSAMPEVLTTASFSASPLIMDPPPQPQRSLTRAYNSLGL